MRGKGLDISGDSSGDWLNAKLKEAEKRREFRVALIKEHARYHRERFQQVSQA